MEKAVQLGFDGPMPFLQVNGAHIGHGNIGACRKDNGMQPIKVLPELGHDALHGIGIAQVNAQRMRPNARRGQRIQGAVGRRAIRSVGEGDITAALGEAVANTFADPAAATDDDNGPGGKTMPGIGERGCCGHCALLVAPCLASPWGGRVIGKSYELAPIIRLRIFFDKAGTRDRHGCALQGDAPCLNSSICAHSVRC